MFDSEFNSENDDELFNTYIDKSVKYTGLQSEDDAEVDGGNVQANEVAHEIVNKTYEEEDNFEELRSLHG